MWFVAIGVVLLLLKLTAFGPVGAWDWWIVLMPFALAVIWWAIADHIGLTKKREMQKMDDRKANRRAKSMEALGLGETRKKR